MGIADCIQGEDELNCQDYQCPGYYRCRDSTTCLHPDHLCDGIKHCPQHEDEFTCHLTCPPGCTCQGLELTCTTPFLAHNFTRLRYLDGSRFEMMLMLMMMLMTCTEHVINTAVYGAWREFFIFFKINERKLKVKQKMIIVQNSQLIGFTHTHK